MVHQIALLNVVIIAYIVKMMVHVKNVYQHFIWIIQIIVNHVVILVPPAQTIVLLIVNLVQKDIS